MIIKIIIGKHYLNITYFLIYMMKYRDKIINLTYLFSYNEKISLYSAHTIISMVKQKKEMNKIMKAAVKAIDEKEKKLRRELW